MATGDRVQLADKPTLDAVRNNIGNTNDTGGTSTTGTTQAKLNAALVKTDGVSQDIRELNSRLSGVNSPYGNGIYGDTVYSPTTFVWPSQDSFNRYVLQFDSLIIPAGVTMRPPEKCDGLYILCRGNVTINGIIDITGLRKTFTEDTKISSTINVDTKTYTLAKGGYAPKGGASGATGNTIDSANDSTPTAGSPAVTPSTSISGSVCGGGVGYFGGSVPSSVDYTDSNGDADYIHMYDNELPPIYNPDAPTAVVIIAAGTVSLSGGQIIATATPGKNAEDGYAETSSNSSGVVNLISAAWPYRWYLNRERKTVYIPYETTNKFIHNLYITQLQLESTSSRSGSATFSGSGAIPPSGGGAVTIICKVFSNTGSIDTSGSKLVSPDGANDTTLYRCSSKTSYPKTYGSEGGKGGTFISTPGEIKIYETGGNS